MDLTSLLTQIISAHDWYAVAAVCLWLLVYLWSNVPAMKTTWEKIPKQWRVFGPLGIAFATAFVEAWAAGRTWKEAILQGISGVLYIGLSAVGLHKALTDLPIPYNSRGPTPNEGEVPRVDK